MMRCRSAGTAWGVLLARFQPYSMAVQTRFKWRHKETDRWRRLMDATCFPVDWLGQTRGPNFSQYSGHWTHLVTCAHVICPWDYPNYYPPDGPTRFVSRITLADTMSQVRLVSLQGTAVYKHFTSNQHVYVHSNPRLDLCVLHPEQNLKRSGEMKMLWMQNEGYVIRPRLELNHQLQVGDHVWIYGMSAHESLFDEEKGPEPLMVPTGIRARVHTVTREHFFLDTKSLELEGKGAVHMGMCGSVVVRDGKCVGMLTAIVHEESKNRELAGTAMCTYSQDIFEFLLEVEKQMKNPLPRQSQEETQFEAQRRREGKSAPDNKDWELDRMRSARHIPVPVSLWHMEEKWMTEEDFMTSAVFGRSGVFNQETQENTLGYDMNSSKTYGERPGDIKAFSTASPDSKPPVQGERKDYSPTGVYAEPEDFKQKDVWDYSISEEMRSLFDRSVDDKDAQSLNMLRKSLENIRAQRAMEQMKESAMKHPGGKADGGDTDDPLGMGGMAGHYGGSADAGSSNFDPDNVSGGGRRARTNYGTGEDDEAAFFRRTQASSRSAGATSSVDAASAAAPYEYELNDAAMDQQRDEATMFRTATLEQEGRGGGPLNAPPDAAASSSNRGRPTASSSTSTPPDNETPTQRKKRERKEQESAYQEELRRRHGHKAMPFGDPDLAGMWDRRE